jgi:hypothetical protein
MAVRKSWQSHLSRINALAIIYLVFASGLLHAGTTPLDAWNDWILAIDHPDAACTPVSSAGQVVKVCSWHAPLALNLSEQGATFAMGVETQMAGWVG